MGCEYGGRTYTDGDVCCQNGELFHCLDGAWVPLDIPCTSHETHDRITAQRVENAGRSATHVFSVLVTGCVEMQPAGIGKFALQNHCDRCMIASVTFLPQGTTQAYRLEPHGRLVEDTRGTYDYISDERPC